MGMKRRLMPFVQICSTSKKEIWGWARTIVRRRERVGIMTSLLSLALRLTITSVRLKRYELSLYTVVKDLWA